MTHEPKIVVTGRVLNPPESFKKRNPQLYAPATEADSGVSGGLRDAERKPNSLQALVKRQKVQRRRKGGVVVCVEIIALRNREVDTDNLTAGAKCLRDCVATSLGVDDADKRFRWSVGFCQTSGREQTIVRISVK
jgi:hypothetical protein